MTDKSKGNHGISAFIVENFPGFSVGKKERKWGIRGSATAELIMENCIVPREKPAGQGRPGIQDRDGDARQRQDRLSWRRRLALPRARFHETVAYVKERKAVWQAALQIPKYAIRARGPEGAHRCGTATRLPCGDCHMIRWTASPSSRRPQKLVAAGNGDGSNYQMRAADGRLWIYAGISCGAHDARRKDHRNLRRHQRGAAHGHLRRSFEVKQEG